MSPFCLPLPQFGATRKSPTHCEDYSPPRGLFPSRPLKYTSKDVFLFRGRLIGRTPAFGAGYSGSSPGPGAIFSSRTLLTVLKSFALECGGSPPLLRLHAPPTNHSSSTDHAQATLASTPTSRVPHRFSLLRCYSLTRQPGNSHHVRTASGTFFRNGICEQDLPQLQVWPAALSGGHARRTCGCAAFTGNLYGIVDLLGYHHHQKHHGLKDREGTSQVRGSELSLGGRGFSP